MKENKESSNEKKCNNCGKCCTNILLLRMDEIDKIRKHIKQKGIIPNNKNSPVLFFDTPNVSSDKNINYNISYVDRCPFLSDENQCNIYSVRPQICKTFFCSSWC